MRTKFRPTVISMIIFPLFLFSISVVVDSFNRRTAEFVFNGWINSEVANVQQGNYLEAINRAQKFFVDTGILTGLSVDKIKNNKIINFLTYGEIRPLLERDDSNVGKISSLRIGLFNFILSYSFHSHPDIIFRLYVSPFYSASIVFFSSTLLSAIIWIVLTHFSLISERKYNDLTKFNDFLAKASSRLAHDIRSPLSAIKIASETLPSTNQNIRSMLLRSAERIELMSQDVLKRRDSFEGLSENIYSAKATSIRTINHAIKNLGLDFRQSLKFGQASIEVDVDLMSSEAEVWTNVSFLTRSISNLLKNSVEAIPISGNITIVSKLDPTSYIIEIKDTGLGIPKKVLSQVGQRGFSFGKSTSGHGLGVYDTIDFLKNSGGRVEISSTDMQGTKIKLFLPRLS